MLKINGIFIFQIDTNDILNTVVNIVIICIASNLFFVSAMINDMLN